MPAKQTGPLYAIGQIVELKTPSPAMTISNIYPPSSASADSTHSYRAQWFSGKKLESGMFPEASLKAVSAPQE